MSPLPPAPSGACCYGSTAGRPVGSARRLHPRDAVAERFLDRYVFRCTHPPRPSNLRCAAQLLPSETPPPAQGRHHQTLYRMAEQRAVCAAVPVRALLQLPLLGVNRGYKGLYGGGWPLRGMGAAGTALGAADARTNEHYEIGTILTQKSQGGRTERCTRKIRRCSSLARLRRRSDHELDHMSLQASWQRAVSWRGAASVHGEPLTYTLTRSPLLPNSAVHKQIRRGALSHSNHPLGAT